MSTSIEMQGLKLWNLYQHTFSYIKYLYIPLRREVCFDGNNWILRHVSSYHYSVEVIYLPLVKFNSKFAISKVNINTTLPCVSRVLLRVLYLHLYSLWPLFACYLKCLHCVILFIVQELASWNPRILWQMRKLKMYISNTCIGRIKHYSYLWLYIGLQMLGTSIEYY